MADVNWTWSWSGRCFGYWDGVDLWTHSGKHIGRRNGLGIFASGGRYLGELMGGRLVTNKAKAADRGNTFRPETSREPKAPPADLPTLTFYRGYKDFPLPESF